MGENEFWFRVWAIIGGVISIIVVSCCLIDVIETTKFIDAGYTRESLPGQSSATWVKK